MLSATIRVPRRSFALVATLAAALGALPSLADEKPPSASGPAVSGGDDLPRYPQVSLEEALRRVISRNPTVALALADVKKAEALVRQARAGWLPTLTGSISYTRLDSDRVTSQGAAVAKADTFAGNVALSVPIVVPAKWVAWSHTKDGVSVAQMSAEDAKRQISLSVGKAYLTVLSQHRVIEVSIRARDTARAHAEFATGRLTGGAGNRLDQVRAEQDLATTRATLESARAALVVAQEALGVLLGADTPYDCSLVPELASLGLKSALEAAESKRADLRLQSEKVHAAERLVRDRWSDYLPYLTGVFQPFFQDPASLTQPSTGWQAQILLTIPFYDGGLRYGQQDERRAALETARITLESTLRNARSEVRSSFEQVRIADRALFSAKEAARLAEQALDLATQAYQAGATTSLEVVDAARRARDAETAAVVTEDTARLARLNLLLASGRFP
jgi:outer membrane protein